MTIEEIRNMPVVMKPKDLPPNGGHESLIRAYAMLEKVVDLMMRGVPNDVIFELLAEMGWHRLRDHNEALRSITGRVQSSWYPRGEIKEDGDD